MRQGPGHSPALAFRASLPVRRSRSWPRGLVLQSAPVVTAHPLGDVRHSRARSPPRASPPPASRPTSSACTKRSPSRADGDLDHLTSTCGIRGFPRAADRPALSERRSSTLGNSCAHARDSPHSPRRSIRSLTRAVVLFAGWERLRSRRQRNEVLLRELRASCLRLREGFVAQRPRTRKRSSSSIARAA